MPSVEFEPVILTIEQQHTSALYSTALCDLNGTPLFQISQKSSSVTH
jgi:hypothetical protein